MLPVVCPVCHTDLKEELHFINTSDNFMTKVCSAGDFYLMSDNGNSIDQYEIVIGGRYTFISGSFHKESNSPAFTNLIEGIDNLIWTSYEFVPFENHKEFVERILKLKAFL